MSNPFKFDKKIISFTSQQMILGGSSGDICICAITSSSKPCAPFNTNHDSKCDTCSPSNSCNP